MSWESSFTLLQSHQDLTQPDVPLEHSASFSREHRKSALWKGSQSKAKFNARCLESPSASIFFFTSLQYLGACIADLK